MSKSKCIQDAIVSIAISCGERVVDSKVGDGTTQAIRFACEVLWYGYIR